MTTDVLPIKTDADYEAALREFNAYLNNEPEPGTPDSDRFMALLDEVESWESKHGL
jgi:HTH-type transcriptional regulator/antitoxin HigA